MGGKNHLGCSPQTGLLFGPIGGLVEIRRPGSAGCKSAGCMVMGFTFDAELGGIGPGNAGRAIFWDNKKKSALPGPMIDLYIMFV